MGPKFFFSFIIFLDDRYYCLAYIFIVKIFLGPLSIDIFYLWFSTPQNPPEKEIDAQGSSLTTKKDRKKGKEKDGKKEGSDSAEGGDDYGMFYLVRVVTVHIFQIDIRSIKILEEIKLA